MSTATLHNSNCRRTADVLLRFQQPSDGTLHRAYDHLIAARAGMTLMVPVGATAGRLIPIVDSCPVPWLEAAAILAVDYETAEQLVMVDIVDKWMKFATTTDSLLGREALQVIESFLGGDQQPAIALTDKDWRHTQITLSQGGQPCRVFVGAAGVRLAFTPDFLEGLMS